ncbi:MFS transporter, partial [Patescibacteria group bacterium]|nr:MFS transporter [Patescibacteria group bacterium]
MSGKISNFLINKNFTKLWLSQGLSLLTSNMLNFILMIKIFEATGSTVAVGLYLALYTLPSVFLGLFAGAFIDLWSKRKILILTNAAQALVVLLYLGASDKIWPIYSIVLLYSMCDEFFLPAQASTLPAIVSKKQLSRANSLFMMTMQATFLIGFTIGGPIIRLLGNQGPFILASLFLMVSALSVYFLPKDKPADEIKFSKNFDENFEKIISQIREGYSFIRKERKILIPLVIYVLIQVVMAIVTILFPVISQKLLAVDIRDAGLILITPLGFGMIAGMFALNRIIDRMGKRISIAIGSFLAILGVLGIVIAAPAVKLKIPVACFSTFLLGISMVFSLVPTQTLLQENTPFKVRGRVFGILGALTTIALAVPVFVSAALVDILGPIWAIGL